MACKTHTRTHGEGAADGGRLRVHDKYEIYDDAFCDVVKNCEHAFAQKARWKIMLYFN